MKPTPCQLLDDYVAHDLTGDARARFEAHLPMCPECQRTLREERGLDALLTAALTQFERLPEGLNENVRRRLGEARRRRRVAAVAALAACIVVIIGVGRLVLRPQPPAPTSQVQVPHEAPLPHAPPAAAHARVTFPKGSGVLAVSIPSESPNVTVIQIYTGLRELSRAEQNDEGGLPIPERSDQ